MALTKRARFAPDQLVVCFEGFGSSDADEYGSCREGARLRGDNPTVQRRPQFFVDANTPDDEIFQARAKMYADAGAPPPVRS
jgi:hypothetical protein